jgi:hypothetical protein
VRSRFEGRWARGFEVAEIINNEGRDIYRVRRRSDRSILPVLFEADDVREDHRHNMWWQ